MLDLRWAGGNHREHLVVGDRVVCFGICTGTVVGCRRVGWADYPVVRLDHAPRREVAIAFHRVRRIRGAKRLTVC